MVRVEVRGTTDARRWDAQQALLDALAVKFADEWWRSYPVARVYPWRPWCTWITVNDPGLDGFDETGRDYVAIVNEPTAGGSDGTDT
ncbi:hypothetical protein AB0K00_31175 [Dactylosporangium sp. NPDC049525]|uniref:hypothetical protein n=1 Tax=Dactylosporangium sp. NPDC049525 TaxID=3154730 RepID=UPI003425EE5E